MAPDDWFAKAVYDSILECPSLVKVTVCGYEINLSRKLARLAAKTALDAISLGIGEQECFRQQTLYEDRRFLCKASSFTETNGRLCFFEPSINVHPLIPPRRVKQALSDLSSILPAFGKVIDGLVNTTAHKHPKLASRWATALDWFGEGSRESSDAIALAKLAISLDVLCGGGEVEGITEMLSNLTGIKADSQVITGIHPQTLKKLVENIYNDGRSKIVHGNHHDRLESFANERRLAASFARWALIESAIRLQNHTGEDGDKTFQTIPAQPPMA